MSRLSLIPVLAIAALITTHTGESLAGKVYRWVDADGQVHFGSQPPPEQRTEAERYHVQVQHPTPGSKPAPPPTTKASDQAAPSDEEKPIVLNSSVSEEQSREYCKNAQEFMKALQGNGSTRFKQDDGSVRPFTDQERDEKTKQARGMIEQFCAPKK